ncbi:hypothetical protein CG001_01305 [Mesoplasma coleopterae]|uniref:hypothetical protein n=1 Tax=Mesoplasma coleopterae TaxID=324078 RepID=UPI000D0305F4|nr:hypothetical protein [Mesoplasma coleopterae]AVN62284.1 hypothetical protein CG001_01305 [Mesoplasma coleopterae]
MNFIKTKIPLTKEQVKLFDQNILPIFKDYDFEFGKGKKASNALSRDERLKEAMSELGFDVLNTITGDYWLNSEFEKNVLQNVTDGIVMEFDKDSAELKKFTEGTMIISMIYRYIQSKHKEDKKLTFEQWTIEKLNAAFSEDKNYEEHLASFNIRRDEILAKILVELKNKTRVPLSTSDKKFNKKFKKVIKKADKFTKNATIAQWVGNATGIRKGILTGKAKKWIKTETVIISLDDILLPMYGDIFGNLALEYFGSTNSKEFLK